MAILYYLYGITYITYIYIYELINYISNYIIHVYDMCTTAWYSPAIFQKPGLVNTSPG